MTVDEETPSVTTMGPPDVASRSPAAAEHAGSGGPSDPPPPGSPEEVLAVRDTVARLTAAWPKADAAAVEAVVRSAYDSFRQARVRAYVPILVERRVRRALRTAAQFPGPGDGERN